MAYKRSTFPADVHKLLALIPEDQQTDALKRSARHVDSTGCRGCRVNLWEAVDAADRADPSRPTWGEGL